MQAGDHLISPRPGFTHHGLYVGNNEVIHWLITSCRSANNIMPITIFMPAFIASFFYSA